MTDALNPTPFTAESARDGSTVTLAVAGELDIATAMDVEQALPELEPGDRLILDLRRLEFLDSSGIRVVLALDLRARGEGWSLAVAREPGGPVARVLELCQVPARVLTVDDPAKIPAA
jgi:anti-sigma B factor antagonist